MKNITGYFLIFLNAIMILSISCSQRNNFNKFSQIEGLDSVINSHISNLGEKEYSFYLSYLRAGGLNNRHLMVSNILSDSSSESVIVIESISPITDPEYSVKADNGSTCTLWRMNRIQESFIDTNCQLFNSYQRFMSTSNEELLENSGDRFIKRIYIKYRVSEVKNGNLIFEFLNLNLRTGYQ